MDRIRIIGGVPLTGQVAVSGAKNATLPALAAALLTDGEVRLGNAPSVRDVDTMCRLLGHLGAESTRRDGEISIRCREVRSAEAPYDLVRTMRASILTLGPLLARHGRARVSQPGGCAIGARPVDLHVEAMRALGADVRLEHGYIEARAGRLRGAEHAFASVTVTGTENALMASCLAEGPTVLRGCAREPEVADLAALLVGMGARIEGAGSDTIRIDGVRSLHGAEHQVRPDRIEAGTWILAAALAGERVTVTDCRPEDLRALLERLDACGVPLAVGPASVTASRAPDLRAGDIDTRPYPGFATDLQAQYMVLMTQARGAATISETIFENRFMHVPELVRMGARIEVDGGNARVEGPRPLSGAPVMATDLRASACLVLAGLVASGETTVHRVYHLDRGYERIEEKLRSLGARIERLRDAAAAPGAV
jgi:UDP-N-acetylglucosamine 1-carboxyvinyltransferase